MALNQTLNECHIYKDTKLRKRKRGVIRADVRKDVKPATKALVVNKSIAIFYPRDGNF